MSRKIFYNGEIITVNEKDEVAEAIVTENNKIIYVGTAKEALLFQQSDSEMVDLHGKALLPGFIDCHAHMALAATPPGDIVDGSLAGGCKSIQDVCHRLADAVKRTEPGKWIRGRGYNTADLLEHRQPTRWELDQAAPDNPVQFTDSGGHMSCCNSLALKESGLLDHTTPFPMEYVSCDENGEPDGVLKEGAHFLMSKCVPSPYTNEERVTYLGKMTAQFASMGITTVHDAGGRATDTYRTLQMAKDAGKLNCRVYTMLWTHMGKAAQIENLHTMVRAGFHTGFGDDMLKIGPLKIMIDGSALGGTCATREPYENTGKKMPLSFTEEEIDSLFLEAHRAGFQLTAHCIGDQAIEACLDAYEHVLKAYPRENHRHRIEHCQLCPPDLIKRIHDMGVVPVPNPVFFTAWGHNYEPYFGERKNQMFPVRSFLNAGIICPFGSDYPTVKAFLDPLGSIAASMDRKYLPTQTVTNPKEGITVREAIRCATYYGAYASFDEKKKGNLEPGKLADLVILSDSILDKNPDEIRTMYVERTLMDGKDTYIRQRN